MFAELTKYLDAANDKLTKALDVFPPMSTDENIKELQARIHEAYKQIDETVEHAADVFASYRSNERLDAAPSLLDFIKEDNDAQSNA